MTKRKSKTVIKRKRYVMSVYRRTYRKIPMEFLLNVPYFNRNYIHCDPISIKLTKLVSRLIKGLRGG